MPNTLPLSEQARALLTIADRQSVTRRERDRLIAALDIAASERWSRAQLALEPDQLESLRAPITLVRIAAPPQPIMIDYVTTNAAYCLSRCAAEYFVVP